MKRSLILVPWVAVGMSILGLTSASPATARITQGAGTHGAAVHVLNLHKAYEARLGHTTQGKPAGIAYARGDEPSLGRGGSDCAEPYCPVYYQGGSVQHNPHVYLLLWGPDWSSDQSQKTTASYLESFYAGLGGPQDHWSPITSQYGDSTGRPTFPGSVYMGVYNDTSTPTTGVTASQLAAEADAFTATQDITDLNDAQIVIATQSGTCPAGFVASSCPSADQGVECAWHDSSNEPFINLPYLLDAGSECGEDSVNPSGTYDGFSIVGGHEYAETITDPYPPTGWLDPDGQDGEIADKCAWSLQSSDVTLSTGTFAMQPLWSDEADGCVMSQMNKGDITMDNPGTQANYQHTKLSLQAIGTSSDGFQLTWSASGLPSGLTINSSSGLISGKVVATPGTYNVTVSASDPTVTSPSTVSFSWTVNADAGSNVTNKGSRLCLNDYNSATIPGNLIIVWHCSNVGQEKFSHPASRAELIVFGQCVTDHGGGGVGQRINIYPCTGSRDQEWYHSKGEYILQANNLCLTDPYDATLNGMPVVLEKCTNAKDQQWAAK
jgi:putative Ig domain-containing protein/ricin-type beta-trefoil lectin protein